MVNGRLGDRSTEMENRVRSSTLKVFHFVNWSARIIVRCIDSNQWLCNERAGSISSLEWVGGCYMELWLHVFRALHT